MHNILALKSLKISPQNPGFAHKEKVQFAFCTKLRFFPFAFTGELSKIKLPRERHEDTNKPLNLVDPNPSSQVVRREIYQVAMLKRQQKEKSHLEISRMKDKILELYLLSLHFVICNLDSPKY